MCVGVERMSFPSSAPVCDVSVAVKFNELHLSRESCSCSCLRSRASKVEFGSIQENPQEKNILREFSIDRGNIPQLYTIALIEFTFSRLWNWKMVHHSLRISKSH